MKTKTCTRCNAEKPLTEYYTADRYYCNDCERETSRERMALPVNKARLAYRNACITAKKYGVYNDLTYDDVEYLFKLADGRCAYTGRKSDNLSLEHVIPMSKGGPNTISNILVVDLDANRRKNDGSALEFIESQHDPYTVTPLVNLLATRGNREYREVYEELCEYQRQEANELYRKLIAKIG